MLLAASLSLHAKDFVALKPLCSHLLQRSLQCSWWPLSLLAMDFVALKPLCRLPLQRSLLSLSVASQPSRNGPALAALFILWPLSSFYLSACLILNQYRFNSLRRNSSSLRSLAVRNTSQIWNIGKLWNSQPRRSRASRL